MRKLLLVFFLLLSTSGCGILLGNVRPVEDKSHEYGVQDLDKKNTDWKKLPPEDGSRPDVNNDVSDVAYQADSTGAIISLNSSCRIDYEKKPINLKEATQMLLMGITDITFQETLNNELQGHPALQTTIEGKIQARTVRMRSLVFQHRSCLYDFMYITPPDKFSAHEKDFSEFVSSLHLK